MNDSSQMIPRTFPIWHPPPQAAAAPPVPPLDPASFQTPRPGWINWKGKKAADKRKKAAAAAAAATFRPPSLNELQQQNRTKARRFYPKKRFSAPSAPWNTTSFIIRAKKAGGIASLVSPCPVTPAILPTPKFSPSREGLVDMAKEEWGVDGYGSMKGLIRLRPGGNADDIYEESENESEGDSDSDVEEQHLEVERRLDHDLSRFEMVYPNLLENRVDDQDTHIAQLEEENGALKARMYLMEREMGELRRRVMMLERVEGGNDEEGEMGELRRRVMMLERGEGGNDEEVAALEVEDVSSGRSVADDRDEVGMTPMHE